MNAYSRSVLMLVLAGVASALAACAAVPGGQSIGWDYGRTAENPIGDGVFP